MIHWWWRQPDHFDWLVAYLRVRRMATTTRAVLFGITLWLALVPLATFFAATPPEGTAETVLSLLAGTCGSAAALLWVIRFPTKNQAVAYAITASASIAMAVLAQSDPLMAILACTAFATISVYIALFHTAALMVANVLTLLSVSALPAVALAGQDGVVRAATAYAVMLVVNIAAPCGVQIIVHTLGVDLIKADRDPLTGLYNRRAFYRRTAGLAAASRGEGHLLVGMIDLDRFKRLNDTRGHTEGDRALTAVGRALREQAPHDSVVGRAGGEEFLVAVHVDEPVPGAFGRALCDAVAALPYDITASVGSASIPFGQLLADDDPNAVITALVGAADAAMYEAKRSGGNRTRHHQNACPDHRAWNPATQRWEARAVATDPSGNGGNPRVATPDASGSSMVRPSTRPLKHRIRCAAAFVWSPTMKRWPSAAGVDERGAAGGDHVSCASRTYIRTW